MTYGKVSVTSAKMSSRAVPDLLLDCRERCQGGVELNGTPPNLGAVVRSAVALGWDALLLTPQAADPLYRRAIRVSMGAVFRLPWARLPGPVAAVALWELRAR